MNIKWITVKTAGTWARYFQLEVKQPHYLTDNRVKIFELNMQKKKSNQEEENSVNSHLQPNLYSACQKASSEDGDTS